MMNDWSDTEWLADIEYIDIDSGVVVWLVPVLCCLGLPLLIPSVCLDCCMLRYPGCTRCTGCMDADAAWSLLAEQFWCRIQSELISLRLKCDSLSGLDMEGRAEQVGGLRPVESLILLHGDWCSVLGCDCSW